MVDTTLSQPLNVEPPLNSPMVDAGGQVTQQWREWFTQARDRLVALEARVTALEPP